MNKKIFSLPVSKKHQTSMKRRFIIFSSAVFLLIFILGGTAFVILMRQILQNNTGQELTKTVELERLRLEASVNTEIAIVIKMAGSPLIKNYLINPENNLIKRMAIEEIDAYRKSFDGNFVFWISDKDKFLYRTESDYEHVNTNDPENYWYYMSLHETEDFNFNINTDHKTNITYLWINAPVFDNNKNPIGIVGTGINISHFINSIYSNYMESAHLYFFNEAGEITGARSVQLVRDKINIEDELDHIGTEILEKINTLKFNEIKYFNTGNKNTIAVIAAIPSLNWYIAAIHHFTIIDSLQTGMTLLFTIMMFVVFTIFAVFNIFVAKLLEPLYHIVNEVSQISTDWDLKHKTETNNKDEIETLGEFLNMTIIDQLTGIYNRRFFDGNMINIIRSLSRNDNKLSLLMIDIDFFKKYNDTYGHDMGDKCLKDISNILSKTITREDDFVARYGGEEFVVVLPNTDENGAKLIAEKLLKNVRDAKIPHKENTPAPIVTVSIGGTTGSVIHSQTESDYVKCADIALYKSKQNGRNRYTFEEFHVDSV